MNNRYLEKIAAATKPLTSNQENGTLGVAAGGALVAGGVSVAREQFHRGHLTGRETLFHGSSAAKIEKIKDQGIRPNQSGGISGMLNLTEKNKNLSFADHRKSSAREYGLQQTAIESGKFNPSNTGERVKLHLKALNPLSNNDKVVQVNLPTWRAEHKGAWNPEVRHMLRSRAHRMEAAIMGLSEKERRKMVYTTLQKSVHVQRGPSGIRPEFIKESPHYRANSLGEVKDFVKHNPKRFLKGVSKLTAGAGAAAGGLALLAKTYNDYKKS